MRRLTGGTSSEVVERALTRKHELWARQRMKATRGRAEAARFFDDNHRLTSARARIQLTRILTQPDR
ncbi:hypothetical protein NL676_023709 [Syzygium grande]|nr:hypothetical protein NL676_023709 [Syzygium grande]